MKIPLKLKALQTYRTEVACWEAIDVFAPPRREAESKQPFVLF